MLFLLPFNIITDNEEVISADYLVSVFKREHGYSIPEYIKIMLKIYSKKLLIMFFYDIATSKLYFTGLEMSLRDYLGLKWSIFRSFTTGELLNRQYEKGEATSILIYCMTITIVVKGFDIILTINHLAGKTTNIMGLFLAFGIAFHMIFFLKISNTLNSLQQRYFIAKNKARSLLNTESSNFSSLKTYNISSKSVDRVNNAMDMRAKRKISYFTLKAKNEFVYKIIEIMSLVFAFWLYYSGIITVKFLDATISQIIHLYESMRSLLRAFSEFNDYFYIFYILNLDTYCEDVQEVGIDTANNIFCNKVFLSSSSDEVTCTLKNNEKTAVIGANANDFLKTLVGFLDYKGSIKFDDTELSSIKRTDLYSIVTFISQDDAYVAGTIMKNLQYGNELSEKDVIEACKYFDVDKLFSKLDNGYYMISNSNGTELSGGLRQRVSFMRGVLRKTPILVVGDCLTRVSTKDRAILMDKLLSSSGRMIIAACNSFEFLDKFDQIIMYADRGIRIGSFKELEDDLRMFFKC